MTATNTITSRSSARRSRSRSALALGVVAAVVAALAIVAVPSVRASATTVGDGECASTVDGLTVGATRSKMAGVVCGLVVTAGSGTWTVPAGVTKVYVTLLGGGGGGGNFGGGGGGGIVLLDGFFSGDLAPGAPTLDVTPGQVISVSVGAGGFGGNHVTLPTNGGDSTFGTYVAKGGGAGGNWDPSTGVGAAGSAGGSGGGGAPTATVADQANPGVVKGAAGGASTAAGPIYGNPGGQGAGTRTNRPGPAYTNFLAGGAGGSLREAADYNENAEVGGPYVGGIANNRLLGGTAHSGVTLGLPNLITVGSNTGNYGRGGGGGIAGTELPSMAFFAGNTGSSNVGGVDVPPVSTAPGSPDANRGDGGGGGGSIDGLRMGADGGSGLVAIGFVPTGGGASGAPSAPTNVNGTPGTGSADVSWTTPDSDGGSAITTYVVEWSTDGGATWTPAPMCAGDATSCTVTGLLNGTGYVFRVSATNANGTGPWSDPSGTVTPGTGPRFAG